MVRNINGKNPSVASIFLSLVVFECAAGAARCIGGYLFYLAADFAGNFRRAAAAAVDGDVDVHAATAATVEVGGNGNGSGKGGARLGRRGRQDTAQSGQSCFADFVEYPPSAKTCDVALIKDDLAFVDDTGGGIDAARAGITARRIAFVWDVCA